jgi:hypothetical protein
MASELWIAAAMRQSDAEIETIAARPFRQRPNVRSIAVSRPLCKRRRVSWGMTDSANGPIGSLSQCQQSSTA